MPAQERRWFGRRSRIFTNTPSSYSPANGLPVGITPFNRYDNSGYCLQGRFSKFVVYTRTLSDADAVSIHNNFASSTGLVSGV